MRLRCIECGSDAFVQMDVLKREVAFEDGRIAQKGEMPNGHLVVFFCRDCGKPFREGNFAPLPPLRRVSPSRAGRRT